MILRRVIEHFRKQEWTAIALDFLIVVVGVFIGIQVANWNDARAFREREIELLIELRRELEASIASADQMSDAFTQVGAAGKRSLDFIAAGEPCEERCWDVLVDFFHASQWQPIDVKRSTYDEMRRMGLPRSREIIDAMEFYLARNANGVPTMSVLPAYRFRVRELIPVSAQEFYWDNCFDVTGGEETYVLNCPSGVSDDVAERTVENILAHPDIQPLLTQWIGHIVPLPSDLAEQNEAAVLAVAAIDAELERRQ